MGRAPDLFGGTSLPTGPHPGMPEPGQGSAETQAWPTGLAPTRWVAVRPHPTIRPLDSWACPSSALCPVRLVLPRDLLATKYVGSPRPSIPVSSRMCSC